MEIIYQLKRGGGVYYICMILLYMLGMATAPSVIGGVQWLGDQSSCSRKLGSSVVELMQLQYDLYIIVIKKGNHILIIFFSLWFPLQIDR